MSFDVGGHKGGAKADINVTPLVDIVLVLLIIFIVITPAVNNSVKLPLAKHTPKVVKNPGDKYMTIIFAAKRDSDGRYVAPGLISVTETSGTAGNEEKTFDLANPASAQKLSDTINANVSQLLDKRVFVKADADLPYKVVDQLFQLARAAGAQQASIVTGEDKKPEGGSN